MRYGANIIEPNNLIYLGSLSSSVAHMPLHGDL